MEAIRKHSFPGNIRELELLLSSAALLALADALHAARSERAVPSSAHTIPIPNQLVRRFLTGSWVEPEAERAPEKASIPTPATHSQALTIQLKPGRTLHEVAQDAERQIYAQLYAQSGDFAQLAQQLLDNGDSASARRVQLRYNQLGLRVRRRRARNKS